MRLTKNDIELVANRSIFAIAGCYISSDALKISNQTLRNEILQAFEDAIELRQLKRTVCYCNTAAGRKENCACHCHKIEQKYTELIKKRIGRLPTFCRICNQKLAFQNTQPNHAVLGCTINEKKGRKVADDHYAQSRTEIGYDQLKICEGIEQTLRSIMADILRSKDCYNQTRHKNDTN